MKFVLIILIVFDLPVTGGTWGSTVAAEFDNRAACERAAEAFKQMRQKLSPGAKAMAACMPKGDEQ